MVSVPPEVWSALGTLLATVLAWLLPSPLKPKSGSLKFSWRSNGKSDPPSTSDPPKPPAATA